MNVCVQLHVALYIMVQEMCYVRNTDMKYAYSQEHEGHLGLMRIRCNCKPRGFKQGCVVCYD